MPSATQMSGLRRRNTGYRHSRIDDVFAKRRNGTNSRRWSPQEFHGGHLRAAQQVRLMGQAVFASAYEGPGTDLTPDCSLAKPPGSATASPAAVIL
ncbi:unnamed protein product [Lampetra fluviatilis]